MIQFEIRFGHHGYRETPFERFAYSPAVELFDTLGRIDRAYLVIDDEPTNSLFDYFGH